MHEKLADAGPDVRVTDDLTDQFGDLGGAFFLRSKLDGVLKYHLAGWARATIINVFIMRSFAHDGQCDIAFVRDGAVFPQVDSLPDAEIASAFG